MLRQILVDLGDQAGVVGAVFVEPEHSGHAGGASPADCQFHPVADRGVLGLAHAPDIAGFHGVFEQGAAGAVDDAHGAVHRDFEGLVV